MGKEVTSNENTGLSGNAGNATGKNLIKGVLKDKVWYIIIGIGCFIVGIAVGAILNS